MRSPDFRRIESAENHLFTAQYSQPEEYHYCQDSVIFPMFLAAELARVEIGPSFRALDVCAGCGVVGLELAHYEKRIEQFDFMEIQPVFREHFEENRGDRPGFRFWEANYDLLLSPELNGTYDLIVGNPPYFIEGEGLLPASSVKSRCRFFLDSDAERLLRGCANALRAGGSAYLLMKSGRRHGRDSFSEAAAELGDGFDLSIVAEIRGTSVLRIRRG